MSRLIPQQTVDTLRQYASVGLMMHGIDCELYIPKPEHMDQQDADLYDERPSLGSGMAYTYIKTVVHIEWSPNIYQLRRFGIMAEQDLPSIAWFDTNIPVIRKSWFRIAIEYLPRDKFATNEFQVVDNLVKGVHDAVILNAWKIAPLRKQAAPNSKENTHV